jgi:hypothetical protein
MKESIPLVTDDHKPVYNWEHGWQCNLCREPIDSIGIYDHMRLLHPDVDAEPERWPDGGLVVEEDFDTCADIRPE